MLNGEGGRRPNPVLNQEGRAVHSARLLVCFEKAPQRRETSFEETESIEVNGATVAWSGTWALVNKSMTTRLQPIGSLTESYGLVHLVLHTALFQQAQHHEQVQ